MEQNIYIPGDLVKYDNDLGKVTEIGTSDWYDGAYTCKLRFFSSHNYFMVGQCDIEPIPLTPAILGKNGWKKEIVKFGTRTEFEGYTLPDMDEYGYFPIILNEENSGKFTAYPYTDGHSCKPIAYLNYVHELQHLLFGLKLNSEMEV